MELRGLRAPVSPVLSSQGPDPRRLPQRHALPDQVRQQQVRSTAGCVTGFDSHAQPVVNNVTSFTTRLPVADGRVVSALDCCTRCFLFECGILPLLKHTCGEQRLAAMLAVKKSAGVTPEVAFHCKNVLMYIIYMPLPSANKVAHSGFETQRSPR